jgi:purine-nucleoside phosphorylase
VPDALNTLPMKALAAQVDEASDFVCQHWPVRPRVGIILGTGLGGFADEIDVEHCWPYDQVPNFPTSTALGHRGQLCCGRVQGVPLITMEGRFHLYEGYSPGQITLPVRVMHRLGVELLIVSNASGGLDPNLRVGDVVVMGDHINAMFANPLIGWNDSIYGPRFPDMSRPYNAALIEQSLAIARRHGFRASPGTYVSVVGPNYETRAEYRLYRRLGGDVIGMSTVPEVIVAAQLGLKVLAISTVTNVCRPDCLPETDGNEVAAAAAAAESKLRVIVREVLQSLSHS